MRMRNGVLAALLAAGLTACGSSASFTTGGSPSSAPSAKTGPVTAQTRPTEPKTQAGARAAAARFYGMYAVGQFAASWDLLAPTAKREVPKAVWIGVHNGCAPASARKAVNIKYVTIFGDTAIITGTISSSQARHHTARNVFNYIHGHWSYSPTDLSIYQHGSIAADIAAARAAGFCTSRKASTL
jgi:hypothetical protein